MPFNQANPADNEKIRRLGIVIRPNWKAIEEGSENDANPNKLKYWALNLFERDNIPAAPGADAPQVDEGIALYSKTDSDSGLPELFFRAEDSTVVQLSKYPPNIAPAAKPTNGETFLSGGLLMKYALTDAIGSNATQAFTWQGTGANQLGLTDFPNNCFCVIVTPNTTNTGGNAWKVSAVTTSGFTIINGNFNSPYFVYAIGN